MPQTDVKPQTSKPYTVYENEPVACEISWQRCGKY